MGYGYNEHFSPSLLPTPHKSIQTRMTDSHNPTSRHIQAVPFPLYIFGAGRQGALGGEAEPGAVSQVAGVPDGIPDVPVVPGGEAAVGVDEAEGGLVVAERGLLPLGGAVAQRVGVHLQDVPFDGAHFEGGQRCAAHHADEPVPPAVVVHQVLQPPAHLVVPPLVLARVVAVPYRRHH